MPGESSSETGNPYGRMHVTEPVRATIPVQNGARLSWDRSIDKEHFLGICRKAVQDLDCRRPGSPPAGAGQYFCLRTEFSVAPRSKFRSDVRPRHSRTESNIRPRFAKPFSCQSLQFHRIISRMCLVFGCPWNWQLHKSKQTVSSKLQDTSLAKPADFKTKLTCSPRLLELTRTLCMLRKRKRQPFENLVL